MVSESLSFEGYIWLFILIIHARSMFMRNADSGSMIAMRWMFLWKLCVTQRLS